MKDLIILVADLDTENVLLGLLPRLEHFYGTSRFSFDIRRHPNRYPGCYNGSVDFLRPLAQKYHYALVVFDREGSGQGKLTRVTVEENVESNLQKNGWHPGNVPAIVIDPEVENCIWLNSPRVSNAFNWNKPESLYDWLQRNGWLAENKDKPERPKEALEAVLKKTQKARSASVYQNIAKSVSFSDCKDEAFLKLIDVLKNWFMPETATP